jgi:hypothetical protein
LRGGASDDDARKYAMTKVTRGDYLLPSNDGETIWRIHSYKDGPSCGLDPKVFPTDFTAWALRMWTGSGGLQASLDLEDWDRWRQVAVGLKTRADAIAEALRIE